MDGGTTSSLLELLATLEDPRDPRGRIHPLSAILGLAAVALMAGCRGLEGIAQFGRDHGPKLAWQLGFRRGKTPAKSTFSEVLRLVDAAALEALLRRWAAGRAEAAEAVALDGKFVRGSTATDRAGLHLLTLFAPEPAVALGQMPVPPTTNEYKVALVLLGILPLAGKVVTGDAMFCQPEVCDVIRAGGGDYLLVVKDNQPTLRATIASAFAEAEGFSPLATARAWDEATTTATDLTKGHGRIERRTLTATTFVTGYANADGAWTDLAQVYRLEARRTIGGRTSVEVAYGITSLGRERADAARLLRLKRGHWGIENGLHYVRDVVLGEDACRVRTGNAPAVMSALRNVAVHLARKAGTGMARAARRWNIHPSEAIGLLKS